MIAFPSAVIYIRLCCKDHVPQTCVEGPRQGQRWYRAGSNDIDETDVVIKCSGPDRTWVAKLLAEAATAICMLKKLKYLD